MNLNVSRQKITTTSDLWESTVYYFIKHDYSFFWHELCSISSSTTRKNIKNPFTINFIVSIYAGSTNMHVVVVGRLNDYYFFFFLLLIFALYLPSINIYTCFKISSKDTIAKNILIAWPWYFSFRYDTSMCCCSCLSNNFLFSSFVVNKQHSTQTQYTRDEDQLYDKKVIFLRFKRNIVITMESCRIVE